MVVDRIANFLEERADNMRTRQYESFDSLTASLSPHRRILDMCRFFGGIGSLCLAPLALIEDRLSPPEKEILSAATHEAGHLLVGLMEDKLTNAWISKNKNTTDVLGIHAGFVSSRPTHPFSHSTLVKSAKNLLYGHDDENGNLDSVGDKEFVNSMLVLLAGHVASIPDDDRSSPEESIKQMFFSGGRGDFAIMDEFLALHNRYGKENRLIIKEFFVLLREFFSDPDVLIVFKTIRDELFLKGKIEAPTPQEFKYEIRRICGANPSAAGKLDTVLVRYNEMVKKGLDALIG